MNINEYDLEMRREGIIKWEKLYMETGGNKVTRTALILTRT